MGRLLHAMQTAYRASPFKLNLHLPLTVTLKNSRSCSNIVQCISTKVFAPSIWPIPPLKPNVILKITLKYILRGALSLRGRCEYTSYFEQSDSLRMSVTMSGSCETALPDCLNICFVIWNNLRTINSKYNSPNEATIWELHRHKQ